jgi:uncharacterized protein YeaO (DUF488 family)
MTTIAIKRAYDPPSPEDGFRVLVDRLWPRGMAKDKARVDFWLQDVAPSAGLRRWFGHDPARWPEFQARYRAELADNPAVGELQATVLKHKRVTLLFAARDTEHNHALVLQAFCERRAGGE